MMYTSDCHVARLLKEKARLAPDFHDVKLNKEKVPQERPKWLKKLLLWNLTFFLTIFTWEHIATVNKIPIKPTYFIDTVTSCAQKIWELLGIICAYIGTYYEYLHLEELGLTAASLVKSVAQLLMSFKYFEYGFCSIASLYDNPTMVYICSAFVIITFLYFTVKFCFRRKIKKD